MSRGAGAGGAGVGAGAGGSDLGHGQALPRVSVEESVDSHGGETDGEAGAASATEMATLVEPSFDENILRALCDTDVSSVAVWVLGRRAWGRPVAGRVPFPVPLSPALCLAVAWARD